MCDLHLCGIVVGDKEAKLPTKVVHRFQSTHPRGVRLDAEIDASQATEISIHAPLRGATQTKQEWLLEIIKFQSTHPRGVRLLILQQKTYRHDT